MSFQITTHYKQIECLLSLYWQQRIGGCPCKSAMAFTNTLFTEEARIKKKDITKQMDGVRNQLPGYPLQGGLGHGREEMQLVFAR